MSDTNIEFTQDELKNLHSILRYARETFLNRNLMYINSSNCRNIEFQKINELYKKVYCVLLTNNK